MEICGWWLATIGVWLLTLSSVTTPELVTAAVCGLLSGTAAWGGRKAMADAWRIRLRWAAWLGPVAVAAVLDCGRLLALAARQAVLLARGPATQADGPGRLRGLALADVPARHAAARRALATIAISSTPGNFVIDSRPDEERLVIHSLVSGWPRVERTVSR